MVKRYDAFDLFKLIASLLIFSMHRLPFADFGGNLGKIVEISARWGVPFFFITSSFFLFSKHDVTGLNISKEVLHKYIKRIVLLYFVWFIFNSPSIIYSLLLKDIADLNTWINFIKGAILSSSYTGSWYMLSCIFCGWAIYKLAKRFTTNQILGITFCIHLICIFTSAWSGFIPEWSRDILCDGLEFPLNIFGGLFYFALGKYIADNKEKITSIGASKCLISSIIFYIAYIVEILVLTSINRLGSTDVAFSLIPVGVCLCAFCMNLNVEIKHASLYRKISTIVYCSQGNILPIAGLLGRVLGMDNSFVVYVISIVILIVVIMVVLYLQRHYQSKLFKYLT